MPIEWMAALEPRVLFSDAPSDLPPPDVRPPNLPQDPNVQVIHIGPNEQYQTFDDVKWPTKTDPPVEFLVDGSPTAYHLKQRYITGNVWIEPSDWNDWPTLQLDPCFKKSKKTGGYIAGNPTLNVAGTLTIRGMNTIGGEDAVLLGSSKSAIIDCEAVHMLDGGAIWRGDGANDVYFRNNEVLGIPRANVYSSYTYTVQHCVIDNSDIDVPIPQGGHMVGKSPVGEAAIRIMNVNDLALIGLKTSPWFYAPGKEWKQDVQLRPASKHISVIDCDFYMVDIGDMAWRKPAKMVDEVDFVDCTLAKTPSLQPGAGVVTLTNCLVNGRLVTKSL